MSSNSAPGCDACNKSSLSLMLLRPSVLPLDRRDMDYSAGASDVTANPNGLIGGLVPAAPMSRTGYTLRLLRAGYVHVFIPRPPKGVSQWLCYRVTDNADLIEQGSPVFAQQPQPPACRRTGHNAVGMRLLRIPRAHEIDTIWVAYSANLWNDRLKQQNKANPEAMIRIDLKAEANAGTFRPTEANLRAHVLECAVPRLSINRNSDQDFPFVSLVASVGALSKQLEQAAAYHPATKGRELAVVLKDPVGLAAELNTMRLRRHEMIEQYLLRPEIHHPLQVNKVIQTMKRNTLGEVTEQALNTVAPFKTRAAYEQSNVPQGTEWVPLNEEERALWKEATTGGSWLADLFLSPVARMEVGRVVFPDHEARIEAWAERKLAETWEDMLEYYDEDRRKAWEDRLASDLERLHFSPLQDYEHDWGLALSDYALGDYFRLHFDPEDANTRGQHAATGCSAGSVYCREAWLAFAPAPLTDEIQDVFLRQLDAEPDQDDAIVWRALAGNQKSLIDVLTNDKRDKTYDFIKGLLGETQATGQALSQAADGAGSAPRLQKAVSWLGQATMGFSLGLTGSMAAVAAGVAAHHFRTAREYRAPDPQALNRLGRAARMELLHRACEEALSAAMQGRVPNVPVLIMARMDADTARELMMSRGEPLSKPAFRRMRRKGQVTVGIITDAKTLAGLQSPPGQVRNELAKTAQTVVLNEQALSLREAAIGTPLMTLSAERFYRLYASQQERVARAPALMRAWMDLNATPSMQAARSASMTLDGRLAIGTAIVQGLGVVAGLSLLGSAETADARTDAWLATADGSAGMLGGFAEFGAVAWEHRIALTAGAAATETAWGPVALRGIGAGLGAAGNIVNAWMSFREATKLESLGERKLASRMRQGGRLFIVGTIPLALVAADFFLKAAARKGAIAAGNIVAGQVARIVATRVGTTAVGLTIPGLGWAITAIAVGHTVYVVVNRPSQFQSWLRECYFGRPDDNRPTRRSWPEEERAWRVLEAEALLLHPAEVAK